MQCDLIEEGYIVGSLCCVLLAAVNFLSALRYAVSMSDALFSVHMYTCDY